MIPVSRFLIDRVITISICEDVFYSLFYPYFVCIMCSYSAKSETFEENDKSRSFGKFYFLIIACVSDCLLV